jgi:hypothetical protein
MEGIEEIRKMKRPMDRLVSADVFLDGGSTCICIESDSKKEEWFLFDYSLPHDGRMRYIYRGLGEKKIRIEVDSPEEHELIARITKILAAKFGHERLKEAGSSSADIMKLEPNLDALSLDLYAECAVRFLQLYRQERFGDR